MRINITLSDEQRGNYAAWSVEITGNVSKATMERFVELAKKADTLLPSDILDRNDYIATTRLPISNSVWMKKALYLPMKMWMLYFPQEC